MTNYEFKLDVPMLYNQDVLLELIRRKSTINGGALTLITELKANGYPVGTYDSWDWVTYIKLGNPDDYTYMTFNKIGYKKYKCYIRLPIPEKK